MVFWWNEYAYYITCIVEIVVFLGAAILVVCWPLSRGKLLLTISLVLGVLTRGSWLAWSIAIRHLSEIGGRGGWIFGIWNIANTILGLGSVALLCIFAAVMGAELRTLREKALGEVPRLPLETDDASEYP